MVARGPDERLVRRAALHEAAPCVEAHLVVERVRVLVRQVAHVQHRLPITLQVMLHRGDRIIRLPQVPCNNTLYFLPMR